MQSHFSVIAFFSSAVTAALCQKLAARLLRRTSISWRHSVSFGVLITILKTAEHFVRVWTGADLGVEFSLPIGLAVTAAIGGWFFRFRATTEQGEALGWARGMQLASITLALMFLTTVLVAVLMVVVAK